MSALEAAKARRAGRNPANIALATFLLLLVGVWLNVTKELPWSSSYEATIVFESRNDLVNGSPVRAAGVDVGSVVGIERGPGDTAAVRVRIDDEALPLRRDATAKIRPRIFLEGNYFLELNPGSPSEPELPDGGTIPVGQTARPVQFDQLLTTFDRDVRDMVGETFVELERAARAGSSRELRRTLPALDPALRGTAITAEALRGELPHDLSRAIAAAARTSAALGSDRPALGSLVSDFATVSAALADRQDELRATVSGLDRLTARATGDLRTIISAAPETRALIRELRPALREAPPTLDLTMPLLRQARGLLRDRELPALVRGAGPVVDSLASFAPIGTRALSELADPVSCLIDNAVPVLKSSVEDPPHTTGEPVYRELLYVLVGLTSASQNFDGNGFNTRYHGGAGDQVFSTGPVPGLGQALFGTQAEPVIGSRPRFAGPAPAFRPDAPCVRQEPTDLVAETGPSGFEQMGTRGTASPLVREGGSPAEVLRRLQRAAADSRARRSAEGRTAAGEERGR